MADCIVSVCNEYKCIFFFESLNLNDPCCDVSITVRDDDESHKRRRVVMFVCRGAYRFKSSTVR